MKKFSIKLLTLFTFIAVLSSMFPICSMASSPDGFYNGEPKLEEFMTAEIKKEKNLVSNSIRIANIAFDSKKVGFNTSDELAKSYYNKYGVKPTNVCAEVAIINIVDNLRAKGKMLTKKSNTELFCELIDYALSKKYYSFSGGTNDSDVYKLYFDFLEFYVEPGVISSCVEKKKC